MGVLMSEEVEKRVAEMKAKESEVNAVAEKIADLIASKHITVDMAECALRRAETIVRTRTIVSLTCP